MDEILILDAPVSEMQSLTDWSEIVPLDKVKVQEMVARLNDDAPEFPVVRVEEGWSRNKRLWTPAVLRSIAEQINREQPVGHLGHIPDDKLNTALPDPQTVWLGATVREEAGKTVLYAKGYNLPGAKIRTFLKAKAVTATSWKGKGSEKVVPGKGSEILSFVLDAFDWARKGAQGMNAQVVGIAAEMEEGDTVKPEDIAALTEDQVRQHNPNLVALIERSANDKVKTDLQEMETKVSDLEAEATLLKSVREKLNVAEDADILEVAAALVTKASDVVSRTLNDNVDAILGKKVKDEKARKLLRRLVPIAEMADAAEDEEALEAQIAEFLEKDEDARTIIAEMDTPGHFLRGPAQVKGGNSSNNLVFTVRGI